MSEQDIRIEVVFATPERQELVEINVPAGTIVADAIRASNIERHFQGEVRADLPVGIWGREVARTATLRDGDRIEIYRPLAMDPKEARRQLAIAGRTMVDRRDDPAP